MSKMKSFKVRVLVSCVLVAASAGAVGTRTFEFRKGDDFKGGDMKGVAVDSAGRVRAARGAAGEIAPLE